MEQSLNLSEFWPYQAAVLADLVSQHTHRLIRHFDLNLSQWRVMAAIGDNPGCSSVEVVSVTPMDKGIVSRAVASLTERALVNKTADPDDKRRGTLTLTASGTVIYASISKKLTQAIDDIPLGAENAAILNDGLKHYIEAMQDLLKA